MAEPRPGLPIHSLAEAYLYLMVTPCEACGKGALTADESRVHHDAETRTLAVPVTCKTCRRESHVWFDTRGVSAADLNPDPLFVPTANPTDEPSRIIDVAGWLTLFSVIADAARTIDDRRERRRVLLEAVQCLDEALKFYDPDNDLPPADAFFRERSRRQFRQRPETFARQRLIDLRAKMPHPPGVAGERDADSAEGAASSHRPKRRWWWLWSA